MKLRSIAVRVVTCMRFHTCTNFWQSAAIWCTANTLSENSHYFKNLNKSGSRNLLMRNNVRINFSVKRKIKNSSVLFKKIVKIIY